MVRELSPQGGRAVPIAAARVVMTERHSSDAYVVGVMKMEVEGRDSERFGDVVARAVATLDEVFSQELQLRTQTLAFAGAHLTPGAGNYAPLDFLEIGLAEKLERDLPFLLIITEVDLSSSSLAYTLALPSQLTNIAVISTRRLDPAFWGDASDPDRTADRLAALMLHCFGHLNGLRHNADPTKAMFSIEGVQDLDRMTRFDADELQQIARNLPREARERSTRDDKVRFTLRMLFEDAGAIARAVVRANPFRLLTMMPTMLAAALSVIVVLVFSAETWDVASAVSMPQILSFSLMCLASAAFVLYRAFAFDTLLSRDRRITESGIVTMAATILCLVLTLLLMFLFFGSLMYLVIISVFPERLMESWPGTGDATTTIDHLKLSLFLAAMGVLAGSLGGRSDSRDLVRGVLFFTEET
jgi:predicted Zn-dependent protease